MFFTLAQVTILSTCEIHACLGYKRNPVFVSGPKARSNFVIKAESFSHKFSFDFLTNIFQAFLLFCWVKVFSFDNFEIDTDLWKPLLYRASSYRLSDHTPSCCFAVHWGLLGWYMVFLRIAHSTTARSVLASKSFSFGIRSTKIMVSVVDNLCFLLYAELLGVNSQSQPLTLTLHTS